MASFPLSEIGQVVAHPAKGMSWSKSAIIVKRLAFPKGAIPAHLRGYTEKFTEAAHACRGEVVPGLGAETVNAMNACMQARLGGPSRRKHLRTATRRYLPSGVRRVTV